MPQQQQSTKSANISNVPFGAGIPIHYTSTALPQQQTQLTSQYSNQSPVTSNIYPNLRQCAPFSYIYPNQTLQFVRYPHSPSTSHD